MRSGVIAADGNFAATSSIPSEAVSRAHFRTAGVAGALMLRTMANIRLEST